MKRPEQSVESDKVGCDIKSPQGRASEQYRSSTKRRALVDQKVREPMGQRIRELREQMGISQEVLGLKFNVSKQYISAIENGNTELHRELLISLANYFRTTLDYIVLGQGVMPSVAVQKALLSDIVTAEILLGESEREVSAKRERLVGGERSVWLPVCDDGLSPLVLAGDMVLADPEASLTPGGIVAVFLRQTRRIWVRRIAPLSALSFDPPYRLLSDSSLYPALEVTAADNPSMLGPILQLIRTDGLRRTAVR